MQRISLQARKGKNYICQRQLHAKPTYYTELPICAGNVYGRAALLVTAEVQHLHDASSSWQVDNDKYDLPEVQVVDPNLDAKLAEQLEAANQGLRHAQKRFADLVSRYDTLACMSKLGMIALTPPMQF